MKVHANGIDIHYQLSGSGPCVVLAHALGSDLSIWQAQESALATRHSVLRYDLRGHGTSSAPAGPYSFDLLAADVLGLLDALGIEQASFVGISLGGMVGQALALAAPQRLAALVLADTTGRYPPEMQAAWPARIHQVASQGLEPLVTATLERWLTPAFRAAQPAMTAHIAALLRATPVAGYLGCCHAIAALDFIERLPALNIPTLVMVGDEDAGTPLPLAQELAAAIPGARLEVIAGAAHLSNLCQPQTFNRLLLDFLA